jgi:hypothetical protein
MFATGAKDYGQESKRQIEDAKDDADAGKRVHLSRISRLSYGKSGRTLDIDLADLDTEKSSTCLKFKSYHELILLRDDFALGIERLCTGRSSSKVVKQPQETLRNHWKYLGQIRNTSTDHLLASEESPSLAIHVWLRALSTLEDLRETWWRIEGAGARA